MRGFLIWVAFATYMLLLTFLAFGSHELYTEWALVSLGIRQKRVEHFVVTKSSSSTHPLFGGTEQSVQSYTSYGPNFGGFLMYLVAGALITYITQRKSSLAGNIDKNWTISDTGHREKSSKGEMRICQECGTYSSGKFCPECGAPLIEPNTYSDKSGVSKN